MSRTLSYKAALDRAHCVGPGAGHRSRGRSESPARDRPAAMTALERQRGTGPDPLRRSDEPSSRRPVAVAAMGAHVIGNVVVAPCAGRAHGRADPRTLWKIFGPVLFRAMRTSTSSWISPDKDGDLNGRRSGRCLV